MGSAHTAALDPDCAGRERAGGGRPHQQRVRHDGRRIGALLARSDWDLRDAAKSHARLLRLLTRLEKPALTFAATVQMDLGLAVLGATIARNLATGGEGAGGEGDEDEAGGEAVADGRNTDE